MFYAYAHSSSKSIPQANIVTHLNLQRNLNIQLEIGLSSRSTTSSN